MSKLAQSNLSLPRHYTSGLQMTQTPIFPNHTIYQLQKLTKNMSRCQLQWYVEVLKAQALSQCSVCSNQVKKQSHTTTISKAAFPMQFLQILLLICHRTHRCSKAQCWHTTVFIVFPSNAISPMNHFMNFQAPWAFTL